MVALLAILGNRPTSVLREIAEATPITLVPVLEDAGSPVQPQFQGPPQEKAADLPNRETVVPPPPPPAAKTVATAKVSPRHEAPMEKTDDFSSRLQSLARQARPPSSLIASEGAGVSSRSAGDGDSRAAVGRDLKDIVRVQVERRWEYDFSSLQSGALVISLRLLVKADGEVLRVEVVDDPRYSARPDYAPCAASARRAALAAAPLQLPPGLVGDEVEVTVSLDPRRSLR